MIDTTTTTKTRLVPVQVTYGSFPGLDRGRGEVNRVFMVPRDQVLDRAKRYAAKATVVQIGTYGWHWSGLPLASKAAAAIAALGEDQ
jgi:hypothetical protein